MVGVPGSLQAIVGDLRRYEHDGMGDSKATTSEGHAVVDLGCFVVSSQLKQVIQPSIFSPETL